MRWRQRWTPLSRSLPLVAEPKPYVNDTPDTPASWALQPRDMSGQFDIPRDPWGRPVEWVSADDLA